MMTNTKRCTQCQEEKPLSAFSVRRVNNAKPCRPFPNPECRSCSTQRSRRWFQANKPRYNQGARVRRQRVKDAVFGAYGGYICACCGETERKFLSIDHIKNDGAKFRREHFGSRNYAGQRTYQWLVKNQFPSGHQVLCMNCNHGKRMNDGVCPHQVRRNDHPLVGVEPSGSKRIASGLKLVTDDEMVSPAVKAAAAS